MIVERNDRINVPERIRNRFDSWGVTTVAWDFDGTLIQTEACIKTALDDIAHMLLERTNGAGFSFEEIRSFLSQVNRGVVGQFGIHPIILNLAVDIAGRRFGATDLEDAHTRLAELYARDIPVVYEGAHHAVDTINATGVHSILSTHAQSLWTWHKKLATGFVGKFERTECFDVSLPKSLQWQDSFQRHHIDPTHVLGFGDNYLADIVPIVQLGGRGVWITNGKDHVFSPEMHNTDSLGQIDTSRIIQVPAVGKVIEALSNY